MTPGTIALLALSAFAAGAVDAVAGGGGLITVPALIAAGLPPHLALGTNKGQAVFGVLASYLRFRRAGMIDAARAKVAFPAGFAGSLLGAGLVLLLSPAALKPVVLGLLVAVAAFLAFRRPGPPKPRARPLPPGPTAAAIALVIGCYDGFFGPGTGTFLIVAFVALLGDGLAQASAGAKVVNLASNLAAFALFAWRGTVLWPVALPMAVAQMSGSWVGAHLAVRRGDAFVRKVVLAVVLALVVKLGRDLLS
ncbi:UPF0721 transmembrane protein [Anaeromyxobacter paludicola]|uniref:Probable membrane transporter protein n=1 Tax=Anaeromyxobacter paludicola TaxID=2918171 RepID=A0ABM7XBF2_9BACT|nr:UPF0721 transmembrane protein [Anaeromyxobacter paludicola]